MRGAGDHFSSGHDLGTPEQRADREARGVPDAGIEFYDNFRKYNLDLTVKWRNLPKPTIAMVRGWCIYGGWMIAAAMDVIFASPDARFLAGLVEYFSIPWDISPRKAKELCFESRFIDAAEAKELGFVNRIYPAPTSSARHSPTPRASPSRARPRCGCRSSRSTKRRTCRDSPPASKAPSPTTWC